MKAPETFRVNLDTSQGLVVIEVTRADAPNGADRFYNLVRARFYDGARFFRVIPGFMAQFGLAADPALTKTGIRRFRTTPSRKQRPRRRNVRPNLSAEPRNTQFFINYGDNRQLDGLRFAPFGKVISGMEFVDMIYSGDRENPEQSQIEQQGNAYLEKAFPKLDYIKTMTIAP